MRRDKEVDRNFFLKEIKKDKEKKLAVPRDILIHVFKVPLADVRAAKLTQLIVLFLDNVTSNEVEETQVQVDMQKMIGDSMKQITLIKACLQA